jgi:thiamine-phosphate pyrophosphorylase
MAVLEAQAEARRKLMSAARAMKPPRAKNGRRLPAVWFMTDPKRVRDPVGVAQRLPKGWGVIYRAFGAKGRFAEGALLAQACRRRGLVLLVAGDVQLARAIRADGVHWPETMLARRKVFGWMATASAHSRMALARAKAAGVDAAILSTVFESRSKSAGRPMGALKFRVVARTAPLPVYGLGGIDSRNAARLAGGAGFASVGALSEI